MKNVKTFRNLIILVLILSLGINIFLYVKYSYLKNTMVEIERVTMNLYCSEFRHISNSSFKVLSEDKLSESLDKINLVTAYVHSIAEVRRSSAVHTLDRIAFNLKIQIEMLQMFVKKRGVENKLAKDLHSTFIKELEDVIDIIEEHSCNQK